MPVALRNTFLFCALAWAGVIFYLSHLPGSEVPVAFFGQDKLVHVIVFGILGFLVLGAVADTGNKRPAARAWLAMGLVIAYGILDEFHQHFVPGRTPDIYDVIADALGGMLGVWLSGRFVRSRIESWNNRSPRPLRNDTAHR